jgi:hypothetical protein
VAISTDRILLAKDYSNLSMDNALQSSGNEFYRTAVLTIVGFIILSCFFILGILEIRSIAFERCIENYGRKIGIQADTVSITKKLFELINPKLSTDMTIEEVHIAFNEVVQTEFHEEGLTLDGGS